MNEIEVNSKTPEITRREGPPFPINLSTKTQNPMVQLLLLEKRGREQRGTEGAPGGDESGVWFLGSRGG